MAKIRANNPNTNSIFPRRPESRSSPDVSGAHWHTEARDHTVWTGTGSRSGLSPVMPVLALDSPTSTSVLSSATVDALDNMEVSCAGFSSGFVSSSAHASERTPISKSPSRIVDLLVSSAQLPIVSKPTPTTDVPFFDPASEILTERQPASFISTEINAWPRDTEAWWMVTGDASCLFARSSGRRPKRWSPKCKGRLVSGPAPDTTSFATPGCWVMVLSPVTSVADGRGPGGERL
mmetsp:Transcript_41575/g.102315  ORF Transcript_41575/g.102315 Transcript_41575/m.102315 type:complete len:235 (-) Transcript_41575:7-711(-)